MLYWSILALKLFDILFKIKNLIDSILFRNWAFAIFDELIRSNYEYTILVLIKNFMLFKAEKQPYWSKFFFGPIKNLLSFSNWEILVYKIGENRNNNVWFKKTGTNHSSDTVRQFVQVFLNHTLHWSDDLIQWPLQ